MKRTVQQQHRPPAFWSLAVLLLIFCLVLSPVYVQAATETRDLYSGFQVETAGIASVAIDVKTHSVLYELERHSPLPATVASRLMLTLLIAENLDPDRSITISADVAAIEAREPSVDLVTLQTGQRVDLEYLVLRFLYYDSKSAIVALAEQFNRTPDQLADLMRTRANGLELSTTTFERGQSEHGEEYILLPYAAATSANDLLRIFTAILANSKGRAYLSRGDAYLQVDAGGRRIVALRSPLADLRVQTEDKISAAYRVADAQYKLDFIQGQTAEGVDTAGVLIAPSEFADSSDVVTLFYALQDQYVRSQLTTRGDVVPNLQQTAENGETFGLIYLDSLNYTHPRNDSFLRETVSYQGTPPYRLPLLPGVVAGQVIFELQNGYKLSVDVGPDRAIVSENNTFAQFLVTLSTNANVAWILFGAVLALFFLLLLGIIRNAIRVLYYWRHSVKK